MRRYHLFLIAILLFVALLNVSCQKVSVAHITINNIGEYEVVATVEDSYVYITGGNSHTFEIGWAGSYVLVDIRVYKRSGDEGEFSGGLYETNVELHDGDHLYFDVEIVPEDEGEEDR